jgi:hypothetical protein
MGKIILDLCGGTGGWSKPYREAGYTVHTITLPEYNVGDYWMVGDAIRFRKQVWKRDGGEFLEVPIKDIHGVLAAPPCTHFSIARRTTAKIPRDLVGGLTTVKACLKLIHEIQSNGNFLQFWAMENPRGYLRKFMGVPPYSFEHWQFEPESPFSKPTDIWGNFIAPKPTVKTKPNRAHIPTTWQSPKAPAGYEHMQLDRAAIRAITPAGFARAFYEANK